jgi:hypothetical protein
MDELHGPLRSFFDHLRLEQEVIQAALAPMQGSIRQQQEALRAVFSPIAEAMRSQQEALQKAIAPLIEGCRRADEARPEVQTYLLERGWYTTYQFPILMFIELHDSMRDDNHDAVDAAMSDFARQQLDATEQELRQRFPDRAQVFSDAFEGHRAGKYTLSIPALLAQVDGVGCEVLGIPRQFFKSKNRTTALERKLSTFVLDGQPYPHGGVLSQMLDPLTADTSIGAATEERDNRRNTTP